MVERWTPEQAWDWYKRQPWLTGCNFVPSAAINQIEMFAETSFDPETIDRELGWAADIGFNTMCTYLHDLCWREDREGFLSRLDTYLEIASCHGIRTLVTIFDDCWHEPRAGLQPQPRPGIHNSGWLRSPGRDVLLDQVGDVGLQFGPAGELGARRRQDPDQVGVERHGTRSGNCWVRGSRCLVPRHLPLRRHAL